MSSNEVDEMRAYYRVKSERKKKTTYIKNLERWHDEPICRAAVEMQMQRTGLWPQWEEKVGQTERAAWKQVQYHVKPIAGVSHKPSAL